ncbi:MAG TPA: hypothetical protein VET23_01915, partial [Chitinophagaceae bacterium]|nr:hypothetical protein [Chitinophagaceae bacterium]
MQKRILTVCLCCFLVKLSAQSSIDVLHYKFKIELNDQDDTIKGTTEIRFVLTGWKGSVSFDLAGTKGKSKGM